MPKRVEGVRLEDVVRLTGGAEVVLVCGGDGGFPPKFYVVPRGFSCISYVSSILRLLSVQSVGKLHVLSFVLLYTIPHLEASSIK